LNEILSLLICSFETVNERGPVAGSWQFWRAYFLNFAVTYQVSQHGSYIVLAQARVFHDVSGTNAFRPLTQHSQNAVAICFSCSFGFFNNSLLHELQVRGIPRVSVGQRAQDCREPFSVSLVLLREPDSFLWR
jgi:hypothetical protein